MQINVSTTFLQYAYSKGDYDKRGEHELEQIFEQNQLNKPASDQEITLAEEILGRKLPPDFIQLLKIANGGYVNAAHRAFPADFQIESGDAFIEVEEIMGVNEGGILLSDYFIQEWGLPDQLVLFSGSGHAWLAFNYEGRDTPNVVYVEPDDGNGNNYHVLAESFTEFVGKLTKIN
ncbi:SMI1/KNR4 family protein [Sporosarcina luteola]|uniref:SMI1/KNR4 family protein n=1 Tax=Sporosarcina luteola TaxID=582850 RepID=UPI00203A4903|nr:SMI1/KNR4 family protein [Sporosarcina luteola]MCM3744697.1 SMI1/KNR4 family protein [Sporosarcina luteola]